jgi:hypothetical protein
MQKIDVLNAGCEPSRGPGGGLVLIRRALRRVLRPTLVRIEQILHWMVNRLDTDERKLVLTETRLDDSERRLSQAEWKTEVIDHKCEGMRLHIEGLTEELRALAADNEIDSMVARLEIRLGELDAKIESYRALHWDHVALARRLAMIEERLAGGGLTLKPPAQRPLIPFPGLEDEAGTRAG